MSNEVVVAKEVAEAEFDRLCELRRINTDLSGRKQEEIDNFEIQKRDIVKEIMRGTFVVLEDGVCTYEPSSGEKLTFHHPTGATLMAMDRFKEHESIKKALAMTQDITRVRDGHFSKMRADDVQFCIQVASLFLARR